MVVLPCREYREFTMFLGREHPFPVLCGKKIRVAAIECLRKALGSRQLRRCGVQRRAAAAVFGRRRLQIIGATIFPAIAKQNGLRGRADH
jgi:hypothetical protein